MTNPDDNADSENVRTRGTTYVLRTEDGVEDHVVSTVEKYYDGLLASVTKRPHGRDGVVVCVADHELPADAFRRINDVEAVAQFDGS